MLISESHVDTKYKLYIRGYQVYTSPRINNRSGGTAIYVKAGIDHTVIANTPSQVLEHTSIMARINGVRTKITSIYQTSSQNIEIADFENLIADDVPHIIGGDFNAKHTAWGSRHPNRRGTQLNKFIENHRFLLRTASPALPTFFSTRGCEPDILDFFIVNRISDEIDIRTVDELSSDHNPVIMEIASELTVNPRTIKVTDWAQFKRLIVEKTPPVPVGDAVENIDENIRVFTEMLVQAIEESSVNKVIPQDTKLPLPDFVIQKIKEKNRVRRAWQRTRCMLTKHAMNKLQSEIHKQIKLVRDERWKQVINDATKSVPQMWKLTRNFKPRKGAPVIHGRDGLAYLAVDKAEAFAVSLESQFSPNPLTTSDELLDEVEEILERFVRTKNTKIKPTSPKEVTEFIRLAAKKTAPGHDCITYKCLKSLPLKAIAYIVSIFNVCLRTGKFPQAWKHATVVLIPKPGKDLKFPQNHRPISLLCTLSKLLEKVIQARLADWVNDYKIIPNHQHGFTKGLASNHQLVRTSDYIIKGFNRHQGTLGVFLDVSKAFDRVWHDGLVFKLISLNCPTYLVKIIQQFMQNRTFSCRYDGVLSAPREITAGVPQGSVLSPTLYNIYVYDLPHPPNILTAQFADDTTYLYRGKCVKFMLKKAQSALDQLGEWTQEWQIAINAEKSNAIHFTWGHKKPEEKLTFLDTPIPWANQVRYLGVIMDKRLTWAKHVDQAIKNANSAFAQLKTLLLTRDELFLSRKIHMYKAVIRSRMTYGCPAWRFAAPTQLRRLESVQSTMIRRIVGAPWFVRNSQLREETKTPSVSDFIHQLAQNHASKFEVSLLHDRVDFEDPFAPRTEVARFKNRPLLLLR